MSSSLGGRTLTAAAAAAAGQVNSSDELQLAEGAKANANNHHNDDDDDAGRQLNLDLANSPSQVLELAHLSCVPSSSSSSPVESQHQVKGGNEDEQEEQEEKRHFLSNYFAPQRDHQKKKKKIENKKKAPISKHQKFNQKVHLAKQESILSENHLQLKEEQFEKQQLILADNRSKLLASEKARLAERKKREAGESQQCCCCCCCPLWCKMFNCCSCCSSTLRCLLISLLILVIYSMAIYALPFVTIQPSIPPALPVVPFDFYSGPLKPTTASAYQVEHLFRDQLHGPESLAFDSNSNAYLAIEGGFILYAHLNTSSPIRRALMEAAGIPVTSSSSSSSSSSSKIELLKIAELNGPASQQQQSTTTRRAARETYDTHHERECQLDEQIYGPHLYTTTEKTVQDDQQHTKYHFKSNVRVSRCSKPLGIRLSQDEQFLYVIDTLNGLFRVNLRQPGDKFKSGGGSQRQVTKLIDFKANNGQQQLVAVQLDRIEGEQSNSISNNKSATTQLKVSRTMNVSLKALDDLVIDHKAGATGGDLIYMTVASQVWPATSFVFDALEGRPSGLVLRLDTATQQLVVLEPARVAHVRSSSLTSTTINMTTTTTSDNYMRQRAEELGAPRLDENDQFDDRPLNFPNGLELMDDRQALLIADTSNKRILKHYVRGPRAGTTDLWAWTPNFPDNIRRGYDKRDETYWVVGCGKGPVGASSNSLSSNNNNNIGGGHRTGRQQLFELNQKLTSLDPLAMLRNWPRVRKFLLKNIYFVGAAIEFVGANVLKSTSIQDMGYELRTGSSLCASGCSGMMILQYNARGDIIRSIHSREFPNDLMYYSQVNELIDGQNAQHVLYLGSPSYSYLTKLVLPTELRSSQ